MSGRRMQTYQTVCLCLSIIFSVAASIVTFIAVGTGTWERTGWDEEKIKQVSWVDVSESLFDSAEGFHKVAVRLASGNTTSYYLRSQVGGVWRTCDTTSESFRASDVYQQALANDANIKYQCFDYVTDYGQRKPTLDDTAVSLIRMQNSAVSCAIVCILCLGSSVVIGAVGVYYRQVSACMVTGVLYAVSGVFLCFTLIIMRIKLSYIDQGYYPSQGICYSLDPTPQPTDISTTEASSPYALCECHTSSLGWSAAVGWVAFSFFFFAFVFWVVLSRMLRIEKTKSML